MSTLKVLTTQASRAVRGDRPLAGRDRLAVGNLGRRRDDDARTGDLGAPTEVEVFAECGNQRVESTDRGEEVRTDQGDATGGDEDVSLEVLLAVVDLTELHAFLDHAESVARLADVQQYEGIVVRHDLGADNAGIRSKCRLHQLLDRVGFETDVVVTKEEERGTLNHQ